MDLVICRENTLAYAPELCAGCGLCTVVCPHGVFAMIGRKAAMVAGERCIECGACARNCPTGAVQVDAGAGCAAAMIHAALTGGPVECGSGCCGGDSACDDGCGSGKRSACC